MFYEPHKRNHGLDHDPFKACVVPRPIGWISTVSTEGVVNLAPYSFYNAVSSVPPMVSFSSIGNGPTGDIKDSRTNCQETGEFVVNVATWDLRDQINQSSFSYPLDVNEMEVVGLEPADSRLVKAPRVAACPIAFECKYWETIELPGLEGRPSDNAMIIGKVVGVHIDESVIVDGRVDIYKLQPLARLGYMDYTVVDAFFEMPRPDKA